MSWRSSTRTAHEVLSGIKWSGDGWKGDREEKSRFLEADGFRGALQVPWASVDGDDGGLTEDSAFNLGTWERLRLDREVPDVGAIGCQMIVRLGNSPGGIQSRRVYPNYLT